MRLDTASKYFDRTLCRDAYNPTTGLTFKAQLNLFDDSMRDGTTVVRRVLSCASTVVLPTRRTTKIHDEVFIIGGVHKDSFDGTVVRQKYVVQRCDGLALVRTADQALRTLAGTDMYASRLWVKDLKELETSSRLSAFLNIYTAPTETVPVGSFVLLGGRWHVIRNTFLGAAGFNVCEADELPPNALTTCSYSTSGVYDPATDTAIGSTTSVPVLQHRWQDDYAYQMMAAERFDDGDVVAHISKVSIATAKAGDGLVIGALAYRLLSVRDDGAGAWTLHARRA